MIIPSKIYTNENGYQLKNVKLIKVSDNTARIFVENNMFKTTNEINKIKLEKRKEYIISNYLIKI